MKRIRHSIVGMTAGWAALQAILFWVALIPNPAGIIHNWPGLLGFGCCSAIVCFLAWLLIYLPLYWCWPRNRDLWNPWAVSLIGVFMGSAIWMLVLGDVTWGALCAGLVGGVGGWMGLWCEEHERKRGDWYRFAVPTLDGEQRNPETNDVT